jgi:iron(III) transport system substrate-binding protein
MFLKLTSTCALAVLLVLSGPVAAAETNWDKLVSAAKAEGQVEVLLGGQMPSKLRKVMPEFTKKYGIKVNYITGSSRKNSARILAERKAGRYTVDAWIGGANTALTVLLPNKMLQPVDKLLIDPKVKDQSSWYKGKHHYTDPEGRYIFTWGASPSYAITINTKLVKVDEINSYWDLLDPKWKGKIVARSPDKRGNGATTVPMYLNKKIGPKWFKRWANEMDVTFVTDARQGAEWVAQGRFAIGMFGMGTPAVKLKQEGFPIQGYLPQVLKEGEILSASAANLMAMDNAPNPNAMQLFINWALSKEGQSLFIKTGETADSLRNDVSSDLIADQYRIKRDRDYYVAFADPVYITQQRKLLKKLRKIMKDARKNNK